MSLVKKNALTLTELILATVLLGVVFITATTFNLAGYNFYYDSSKYVQTELSLIPALEQIAKQAELGNGDVTSYGIVLCNGGTCLAGGTSGASYDQVHIRSDFDASGAPRNTPDNYTDDNWQGFWKNGSKLVFRSDCSASFLLNCCNASCSSCSSPNECIVTNRITNFVLTPHWNDAIPYCGLDIEITGRFDPSKPVSPDNPEVTLITSVCPRSLSLR